MLRPWPSCSRSNRLCTLIASVPDEMLNVLQPALEPMQIDAAPEENDNSVEEPVAEVLTACIDLDSYIASYKGQPRSYSGT